MEEIQPRAKDWTLGELDQLWDWEREVEVAVGLDQFAGNGLGNLGTPKPNGCNVSGGLSPKEMG